MCAKSMVVNRIHGLCDIFIWIGEEISIFGELLRSPCFPAVDFNHLKGPRRPHPLGWGGIGCWGLVFCSC